MYIADCLSVRSNVTALTLHPDGALRVLQRPGVSTVAVVMATNSFNMCYQPFGDLGSC